MTQARRPYYKCPLPTPHSLLPTPHSHSLLPIPHSPLPKTSRNRRDVPESYFRVSTVAQVTTFRRSWLREWGRYLKGVFTQVFANPVIGRELRVRVRFGRSYLLQSAYLAFLIMMAMLLFVNLSELGFEANPVIIQQSLISFNSSVMGILATLIVLIVPGLTASAVTLERERRTIDLLLATPLTARDLLTGKLVGSVAFVVLLLALTLPISAVSVVVGGMTILELLTIYFLMAMSAMVLGAICIALSSYFNRSFAAIIWSYLAVFAFLGATTLVSFFQVEAFFTGSNRLLSIGAVLNPWFAPYIANTSLEVFGKQVPVWVVAPIFCLALTRLVLTASARRVGLYDRDVMPSLRRQGLLLSGLLGYLSILPLASGGAAGVALGRFEVAIIGMLLALLASGLAMGIALFTAPSHDGAPPVPTPPAWFRFRTMLRAHSSGTLNYLLVYWLLFMGGFTLGLQPLWVTMTVDQWFLLGTCAVYFGCLWLMVWAVGRLAYALLPAPTTLNVRILTLVVVAGIIVLPVMIHMLFFFDFSESPILEWWVFSALADVYNYIQSSSTIHLDVFAYKTGVFLIAILALAVVADLIAFARARRQARR